jgi:hypothetical protein
MLAASAPKNGSSQQSAYLPAFERRVQLELQVAALISQAASVQFDVNELKAQSKYCKIGIRLQNAVATLYNTVANLGTAVNDRKGQNNWAVVTSAGTSSVTAVIPT